MPISRLAVCIAVLLTSCATPLTGAMRPSAGPLSLIASPTTARVIFVRPAHFLGSALNPFIFDGLRRAVLGKAINGSWFAVDLEPGVYQLCPANIMFDSSGQQLTQFADFEWVALGFRSPLTRLEVAAGKTYLLQIGIRWGPVIEAIPVRPGTLREARLLEELPSISPAEVVVSSPEFVSVSDPAQLDDWYEFCRESSSNDVRLRVEPDDGK